MRAFLLLLALALLTAATTPPLTVVEVADGDTLRLDDGRWVRLAGIEAPRLGVRGEKPWPLAEAARDALAGLVEGRSVKLRGAREDRYGRVLAQVTRDDGLWIAGEMLRLGLARVHTWPDDRDRAAEMLAIERTARGARRGLWAERFYAALSPEEAEDHLDSFQIVEGLVVQAEQVRDRVYLNFGPDWRTDFTVSVPKAAWRRFRGAGLDPLSLAGRRVRVRGWLTLANGPAIEATLPEQIEPDAP